MLFKSLLVTAVAAGTGLLGAATAAAAPTPAPAPAVPNVESYMPVNPANYTVNAGKWLGFAGPAGVVCTIDTFKGEYGCAGPLPGAPEGMNLVSAGPVGAPVFTATETPAYAAAGPVRPLPPNTRLSFRQIFCGVDDAGVVACLNSREQVGFVVGPDGTSIFAPPPPPPAPAPEAAPAPAPAPVAPPAPAPIP